MASRHLHPAILVAAAVISCTSKEASSPNPAGTRLYRMGFSGFPPRPDQNQAVQAIQMWAGRADAAIMHLSPPWKAMLSGITPQAALQADGVSLAGFYRGKGLKLFVTIDVTDGLNRAAEAPELVELKRSIGEPAVQTLYRQYVSAVVSLLHPDYLGLAAETNLIRLAAPRAVYDAVVTMTRAAATEVRSTSPDLPLYVSVQADAAWGRLGGTSQYLGVEQDFADFSWMTTLGLSSYPYFAYADPTEIPLDYYRRLLNGRTIPCMVVEGGWTSVSVGSLNSSPEIQARYVRRQSELLEAAGAIAWLQLSFTDLDLARFPPQPPGSILPLFAHLGFVDADLRPKAALTAWDSLFAVRRSAGR